MGRSYPRTFREEACARMLGGSRVEELVDELGVAAYERVPLGIACHWPFDQWGRFFPEQTIALRLLDRLFHHSVVVLTDGESFRMREARHGGGGRTTRTF